MKPRELQTELINPTLKALKLYSPLASLIVLETAMAESSLVYLRQVGGGPARGLWQIEPFTARDILRRYLGRRIDLRMRLKAAVYPLGGMTWRTNWTDAELAQALVGNRALGACICRLIYLWSPLPIPKTMEARAAYWVTNYNKGGKASVEKYISANERRAGIYLTD